MSESVKYAENFSVLTRPVERRGILQLAPGQGVSGYGSRISTDYMIRFEDTGRIHRVYAICWSNVASFYVKRGGKALYVKSHELDLS